jgi:5-methylcytosine-specific restriction endonuclease McrA
MGHMLDDPAVVADILRRLRLLNPGPPPPYNPTPSKLRASAYAKEWWEKHPDKRKLVVAQYEARRPEVKQARKARYRTRLLNATGSFTREEWEARKIQFGNRCAYCGRKTKYLTPDHYIPLSRGGTNFIDNIIPACQQCNRHKWNIEPSTFKFPHRTQMIFAQFPPKRGEAISGR